MFANKRKSRVLGTLKEETASRSLGSSTQKGTVSFFLLVLREGGVFGFWDSRTVPKTMLKQRDLWADRWRTWPGSNRRPPAWEAGALRNRPKFGRWPLTYFHFPAGLALSSRSFPLSSFRPDTQSGALKRVSFSIIFQLSGILFQLSAASSAC